MKIGQAVRDDGPQTHLTKAGTPTMGGALIIVSIVITTLLWGDLGNRFVWVVLLVTVGFGAVGWVDDYRKVVHRNPKGLSARTKFALAERSSASSPRSTSRSRFRRRATRSSCGCSATGRQSGFALGLSPQRRPHRAVRQDGELSAGRLRLHRAVVLRHRRHQQRRQPHRRPRRPRHHADGDDRRGARHLRLRHRQRGVRALPAVPVHPRRRRAGRDLRRASPARGSASCGSTRIRPRCSWATSARWRWAARSARWR